MDKQNSYILQTGDKAVERLLLLNEIYGPSTHAFLKKAGLKNGLHVLEVGCGTGNSSFWIAEQLKPDGKVIAIDVSEEQIEVARKSAQQKNIHNIEFLVLSVDELDKIASQFDLVFSRFLLCHLREPEAALSKMYACVKPNGILACEEQCLSTASCYPESEAFNKSLQLVFDVSKRKGVDYNFGKRLHLAFKKLGLNSIQGQTNQPILLSEREKMIWYLFYNEAKENFLTDKDVFSEKEFEMMLSGLLELAKDDNFYILPIQNFQFWGKK